MPTPVDSVRAMRTRSRRRRLPAAGGEARAPCERRWRRGSAMRRGRDEEAANAEGRREVVRAPATDRDMARAALLHRYTPPCVCGAVGSLAIATEARPHPMPRLTHVQSCRPARPGTKPKKKKARKGRAWRSAQAWHGGQAAFPRIYMQYKSMQQNILKVVK